MFSDISSRVQENLSGVRMIRAFVQEKAEMRRFEELNRDYIAQNIRLVRIQGLFQPLLEALIGVTFLVVLWVGGQQVLPGRISLGSFVMFNTYMGMLVWPMIALGWVVNLMQRGTASLSRINEILREQPTIAAPPDPVRLGARARRNRVPRRLGGLRQRPRARRQSTCTFPPAPRSPWSATPDRGKSTLVSLMPRLMDPTGGAVLPGRHRSARARPGGAAPPHRLRAAGDVSVQRDHRREHRLRRGRRHARTDPPRGGTGGPRRRYRRLPAGLRDHGGRARHHAVRRAEAAHRDRPRAAARSANPDPRRCAVGVDTLTEERILTHLAGVMRGRTVILISHRVSTVRQADSIVVLEKGRIVEQGTHAELVEAGGYYADLSQKQMLEEELEAI